MKYLARLFFAFCIVCAPLHAEDAKPSEESLHKVLEVTDAKKLVEALMAQMDGFMKTVMQKTLQGQAITPERQKAIDAVQAKAVALMKEQLDWSVLEPMYLKIYRDSFTQSEVDGMLTFYMSPAGQAVIKKMPLVIQNSMTAMQGRMGVLMQRIQQMAKETAEEINRQDAAKQQDKQS